MNKTINNDEIERYSRQIVLKDVGIVGQKKILNSKILVVGAGGLGCPVIDILTRSGAKNITIADNDKVSLSNLHRQTMYNTFDIGKFKVDVVKKKIKKINPSSKIKIIKKRILNINLSKIINKFDILVDGSDNFKTKFLLNDYGIKYKKILVSAAISKFDGHVFSFNFQNNKVPCLRCFYQENKISDDLLNCEAEGILGTVAATIGILQANEVLKKILNLNGNIDGFILIVDMLNLNFRKAKIKKRKGCLCK